MSIHVVNDVLNLLSLTLTDVGLVDEEEDVATERLNSGCRSRNLNHLLNDLLYVANLRLWSRDETGRVGLAEVDLHTCEQIEV